MITTIGIGLTTKNVFRFMRSVHEITKRLDGGSVIRLDYNCVLIDDDLSEVLI
jgi:hypothetical protein